MAALPDELIDMVSLVRAAPTTCASGWRVYRDAGVGTLGVTPMAWTSDGRLEQLRLVAELAGAERRLRLLLGAFGDPGHAFPMIALGRALRARGHEVVAADVGALARTTCAPRACASRRRRSTTVFPTRERPLKPYEAVRAGDARRRGRWCARCAPDAVVADILTLAPALAGRARGRAGGDAHPPRRPAHRARLAAVLDRRAAAADGGRARPVARRCRALTDARAGARAPRAQRDAAAAGAAAAALRARRDLAASWRWWRRSRSSSTRARSRCPRRTSSGRCCGSRRPATSSCRPATSRWCWWRRRRRRTRRTGCCARRCAGSPDAPVRVLATWNRRPLARAARRARRTRGWSSGCPTRATMPRCDVVVCHGGHGTLARALASGCAVGRRARPRAT